jgi:enamine deaminase RidA (YjgF/YER057c/UK114 family)
MTAPETPEERLAALGLTLPEVAPPGGAYVPAIRTGSYVYTAGQLPFVDGKLPATGKVGAEVTAEQAHDLARLCALNALAAAAAEAGRLSAITRIVKVVGFVASAPDFTAQPQVINGASELLTEVFGDAGKHARSAVGVAVLPLDTPVEVELIAEVASS